MKKRKTLLTLNLIFIFGILIPIYACSDSTTESLKKYQNKKFNFIFDYPENYKVKEYGNTYFSLVINDKLFLDFSVVNIEEFYKIYKEDNEDNLDASDPFVLVGLKRGLASTAADGPDGSYEGRDPEIVNDTENKNDLRYIKFYLTGVRTDFKSDKTTSEKIGPFYFVNVSVNGEVGLLVHYKSGELASDDSEKVISKLVNSISLSN